ncbi:flagellar hook-length control protein FliK [Steroidobacter agaridevorans]|uniref:flagellar hook-length control protein FliK n=1 Tax=Steroidobacter agaridevorans TaxID=2695856 RepID=UPI00137A68A8|nr:flagellar hook-length control protein FliK [Steroidobacter agaridevorans]
MSVASTSTSGAAAPATSASTAPSSVSVDFMSMLGQLAGAVAPTPASTAMQTGPVLAAAEDTEELDGDAESTDMLGMMPMSLPVMPAEVKAEGNAQAATLLGVVAASVGKGKDAVAPEAQLLSDLIQPEQASAQGKFEIPQLPENDNVSPLRQAESAHARPVNVPVGNAQWADEIGSRMTMMVEQGKHTASLRLSPEHLGPLEVRITVNGDQASVQFGAAHVDTRNAIENALPRLREMFASQGLSLADANVSREPPRQQQNPTPQSSSSSSSFGGEDGAAAVSAAQVRLGLLDAYA